MDVGDFIKYDLRILTEEQKRNINDYFNKMILDSNKNYSLLDMGLYDKNNNTTIGIMVPDEKPIVVRFE